MTEYRIHVMVEKGGPISVLGPFDHYLEAHAAGLPYAQEGLRVEVQTGEMVCDFCADPEVRWSYDADDFHVEGTDWASTGNWAACETCKNFIEANDRQGLTNHSVRTFFLRHPEVPDQPEIRTRTYHHVVKVHGEFWKVKKGSVQEA